MKNCTKCGAQNEDNDKFCGGCGAALDSDVATAATETAATEDAQSAPAQTAPANGVKGKIVSTRNKALGFEKKHSIIVNALIAVCAIVIMFVALFAPIKVMGYTLGYADNGEVQDDGMVVEYVEIDQNIWDFVGAIGYIGLDSQNLSDAVKISTISTEYQMAIMAAGGNKDQAIANISGMNYIAYLMANNCAGDFGDMFINGVGGPTFVTFIFGLIVAVLALVTAIISLIYLIFAIVGVVKKKTTKNPFKYLGMVMGVAVSALALMSFAPLCKAGGGMLAILLFAAIVMLIGGAGYSLIMGKAGLIQTIKYAALSLVVLIALCLLFTNTLSVKAGSNVTANVPFGYGLYNMFAAVGAQNEAAVSIAIGSAAIAAFMIGVTASIGKVLICYLKSLACYNDGKTDNDKVAFTNSIMSIIMTVVAIVFAFVGAPLIIKAMNGLPVAPDPYTLVRAQVYVAAAFVLIAAIVMKAFKPADKKFLDEPSLETANGAPAPAQEQAPASVEDVKEPTVDEKPANDEVSDL